MRRCKWHTEDGVRFLVPGCMSRAVYGDDSLCTCPNAKKSDAEVLEDRVARLEALIAGRGSMEGETA